MSEILEELWRIRRERVAACGHDFDRMLDETEREQYLLGRDLWGRSKITGQMEVVFKGSGKPSDASEAATAGDHST